MRQAPLLLPRGQKGSKSEGWETALRVLSLVASKTQLDFPETCSPSLPSSPKSLKLLVESRSLLNFESLTGSLKYLCEARVGARVGPSTSAVDASRWIPQLPKGQVPR